MIKNTFQIFPGIGPRMERYLWRLGIFTWEAFLGADRIPGFSKTRKALLDNYVETARSEWDSGNVRYFKHLLGSGGMWRLWDELHENALYLDIETDGRNAADGVLTVAGFYSHGEYRPYIHGQNLCEDALQQEFEDAGLLVTFSGASFDIPYLCKFYPGLIIDLPHIDLCPTGHKVGLKGGLKKVEKLVGIGRAGELDGMTGYEAVLLWERYMKGTAAALDTLVSYNREDTVNLHPLAGLICERLRMESGLP